MKKQSILFIATFLLALALAGSSYANGVSEVYVSPDGDDNTGTGTIDNPFETVGKGIDALSGTSLTLHMAAGTYNQDNGGVSKDYGINIQKDVTIKGAGKELTIIDAKGLDNIFRISDGYTVTLKDLTLKNGDTCAGGAVYVDSAATLNAINCNFKDNKAFEGGAIYNAGTTSVTNCLFENNEAKPNDSGGAIYTQYGSSLTVTGSTFTGNRDTSDHGGAVFASSVTLLQLIGNNFINNSGNAIYINCFPIASAAAGSPILKINVNRIVGNTPFGLYLNTLRLRQDGDGQNSIFQPIDATNNWWGSNNDPRTLPSAIYDPNNFADTSKWLVLKVSANPHNVAFGGTSLVTASVIYNNFGEDTSSIGHIPDGTPITLTTDIGNVGSKQVTRYTVGGIVTTILRANDGLGIAHVYAILDGFMTPVPAQVVIVEAASVKTLSKTIGMQKTGTPLVPIVLALLMVLGGIFSSSKRN